MSRAFLCPATRYAAVGLGTALGLWLATAAMAEELAVNDGWKFKFDLENQGAEQGWAAPAYDDSQWQTVSAGLSWTQFGYFNYSGVGWYRKTIPIPERFRGKFLVFHGLKERCTVCLAGIEQGKYAPAADPKLRGLFSGTPPFRLRLPNTASLRLALRVEGTDTHAYDTPGPGLVRGVELSDRVLVFHEGYWLAPDALLTHEQWLAEMRAERARRRSGLKQNGRIYTGDYAWNARNFVQAFVYVFDTRFYAVRQDRYLLGEFLEDGKKRFGGYDSLLLWHSYTNIGIDSQNQLAMLRSLPGGPVGLKRLIDRGHQLGVKTYIAYNPWDRTTTQETASPIESLAQMVKEIGADGVFLDTSENAPHEDLRAAIDRARPGVVLEPEGSVPPNDAGNATLNASWGQAYPTAGWNDHARGVPIEKWTEPRHMIHFDGDRWRHDRTAMFQHAFLNGAGVVIWDDIFGSWNAYTPRDQALLRRMVPIQRQFSDLLASDGWEPFYPTLVQSVDASYWPGDARALWMIVNWSTEPVTGDILQVEHHAGTRYFDLWNGVELSPTLRDGRAVLSISEIEPHGLAALLALQGALDADLEKLLVRSLSARVLTRTMWAVSSGPKTQRFRPPPTRPARVLRTGTQEASRRSALKPASTLRLTAPITSTSALRVPLVRCRG